MTGRSRQMKLKTPTLSIKVPPVAGSWTICTWEQHIQYQSDAVTAPTQHTAYKNDPGTQLWNNKLPPNQRSLVVLKSLLLKGKTQVISNEIARE